MLNNTLNLTKNIITDNECFFKGVNYIGRPACGLYDFIIQDPSLTQIFIFLSFALIILFIIGRIWSNI